MYLSSKRPASLKADQYVLQNLNNLNQKCILPIRYNLNKVFMVWSTPRTGSLHILLLMGPPIINFRPMNIVQLIPR